MTHYHPTSNTFKSANPLANVLPPEQQQLPLFYWKGNFFPLTLKVPASLPPSSGGARVSIALTTPNENSAP